MGNPTEKVSCPEELEVRPLQTDIVYGPLRSRRLGLSLGINLLPAGYKICSFNCIYCQYGWTEKPTLHLTEEQLRDLPRPGKIAEALERNLERTVRHKGQVDAITFSGNGEATLHPDLAEIVARTRELRERYLPQAKLVILSNSSTAGKKEVREILERFDVRIMKLDAASEEIVQRLNVPARSFYLAEIIEGLKRLQEVTLQSLFVQGRVTNTDPDSVEAWLEKIREIRPALVQVYTLARMPADRRLRKVSTPTLQWIARQVRWRAGVPAEAY